MKLPVSFVPPVSGLATLHLVVKMVGDLIGTVRLLLVEPRSEPLESSQGPSQPGSHDGSPASRPAGPSLDAKVLRILRANPRATWRVVQDRTGLSDASAKRALTSARKTLRRSPHEMGEAAGA